MPLEAVPTSAPECALVHSICHAKTTTKHDMRVHRVGLRARTSAPQPCTSAPTHGKSRVSPMQMHGLGWDYRRGRPMAASRGHIMVPRQDYATHAQGHFPARSARLHPAQRCDGMLQPDDDSQRRKPACGLQQRTRRRKRQQPMTMPGVLAAPRARRML